MLVDWVTAIGTCATPIVTLWAAGIRLPQILNKRGRVDEQREINATLVRILWETQWEKSGRRPGIEKARTFAPQTEKALNELADTCGVTLPNLQELKYENFDSLGGLCLVGRVC